MAENPDAQSTTLQPSPGALRFVKRKVADYDQTKTLRILQRYEWSVAEKDWGWYDIPLIDVTGE